MNDLHAYNDMTRDIRIRDGTWIWFMAQKCGCLAMAQNNAGSQWILSLAMVGVGRWAEGLRRIHF